MQERYKFEASLGYRDPILKTYKKLLNSLNNRQYTRTSQNGNAPTVMFYKYNLLFSFSGMCAFPWTEARGVMLSTHDPVSHCCVDTYMRAMFTTLLEKADLFSLLLWILSHKHWHTNISGAAIRFQLSDRKHENSEKLEPSVCRQRALGFQQTPKAGNSECEFQGRSYTDKADPKTPSVILHMFLGLPGTRTGYLKSPTSMGSVTRTISSFQPYVLPPPSKDRFKKHLLKGGSK